MTETSPARGPAPSWAAKSAVLAMVVALLVSAQPSSMKASPPASVLSARIRFAGYIQEIAGGQWRIAGVQTDVDQYTAIDETVGPAVPYAWVEVYATHVDNQSLHADSMRVLRAANTKGPIVQYSGTLYKQSAEAWSVSGTLFLITAETHIAGAVPAVGSLLKIVAQDRSGLLYALEVHTIAGSPASVPVEFEGQVSNEDQAGHWWVLDQSTVFYDTQTKLQNGQPVVGETIEVRARLDPGGRLLATDVHVKTGPQSATTWQLQALPRGRATDPVITTGLVSLPTGLAADGGVIGWSVPIPITDHRAFAAHPSVAYTNDGTAHAVWEDNGILLHSMRLPDGSWGTPARVAAGIMPSLVARPDGTLHLAFSHEFMGNIEVYYVTWNNGHWTLPINVSRTSGISTAPSLAMSPDGSLHVAWSDTAPGDPVIYYGGVDQGFWTSQPVPSTRGGSPELVSSQSGRLYLAWQDMPASGISADSEIFLMQRDAAAWSLPVNVSDTPGSPSQGLSLAAGTDGLAHLAWVENDHAVYYAYGEGITWSWPQHVFSSSATLQEPRLLADLADTLLLTWVADQSIQSTSAPARSGQWRVPSTLDAQPLAGPRNLALAKAPSGAVSLTWVQNNSNVSGDLAILQSSRQTVLPVLPVRHWIPLLLRP